MRVRLPNNWTPRPYQQRLWDYLENGGKRAVAVWHRRSGKDDVGLHHTAVSAFQRVGNYWYLLPEYEQARKAIWTAINPHSSKLRIDEAFPPEIRSATNNQEMRITLKSGAIWQVMGSDRIDSLVGSPPIGIVLSEYALSNPRSWGYLRPILLENGGWAVFNSTPRGRNHLEAIYQLAKRELGWFAELLTADQTGLFSDDQLQAERREMIAEYGDDFGDALWRQEYFCSFDAAILGSYFGALLERAERDGRIGIKVPWQEDLPVNVALDLGRTDDTVIWFYQVIRGPSPEIHVIDYHASNGKDIPFYDEVLRSKPYTYAGKTGAKAGVLWLPHDAKAKHLAAGGKSIREQFSDHGWRWRMVPEVSLENGHQAIRNTLPHCWIDEKCNDGVHAMKSYRREWDHDKKSFSDKPVDDWTNDPTDAFRYLSLVWRMPPEPEAKQDARYPVQRTFDEMREAVRRRNES